MKEDMVGAEINSLDCLTNGTFILVISPNVKGRPTILPIILFIERTNWLHISHLCNLYIVLCNLYIESTLYI